MRRNFRVALATLGAIGLFAVVLSANVDAQKVLNPGAFTLQASGGQIRIGSVLDLSLKPNPSPQCSDGLDNDGDGVVDGADGQCSAGTATQPKDDDDSELVGGFQPKVDVLISGTIAANGAVTVPASGIVFPPAYVPLRHPVDGSLAIVTATILATAPATGTIDPISGDVNLSVKLRAKLSGSLWGNRLPENCSIGTVAQPIAVNLTSGHVDPVAPNSGLNGSKYNATTGAAVLVNNSFSVPGAGTCLVGNWPFQLDVGPTVNSTMSLPSGPGRNAAVLVGATTPALARGVDAKITSSAVTGAAPLAIDLSAATSTVAKGPATYAWDLGNGTTATGVATTATYPNPGDGCVVTVKVTDADGDSSVAATVVKVTGTGATTTTTTSTTTTSTTTTTTSTTTTVAPTTTTTTTSTVPPASDDSVSVRLSGAFTYTNSGSGTGNLRVDEDSLGTTNVSGNLDVPGTKGGTARITVGVHRAWILPLWFGDVTVSDPGAGVHVTTPVIGSMSSSATGAGTTSNWFSLGQFPNLFQPYALTWSVTDAG